MNEKASRLRPPCPASPIASAAPGCPASEPRVAPPPSQPKPAPAAITGDRFPACEALLVDPNVPLREAGKRTTEIHLRNKNRTVPTEAFGGGDIDPVRIAATLKELRLQPLVVIELACHSDTIVTRSLRENPRLSRLYTEKVFSL